jgi:anti-sigma factor RsiW
MSCSKKEKLQQFADGELSENESQIILAHLDDCDECRDALDRIKADVSFIREKMNTLNPAAIPARAFVPAKAEQIKARRLSAFQVLWHTSVRIPTVVLIVMGTVFLGLIFGLLAQSRRLARLESGPAVQPAAETIFVSSASSFQAYGLDIDLKNYQPIDHPNIIFLQKETR